MVPQSIRSQASTMARIKEITWLVEVDLIDGLVGSISSYFLVWLYLVVWFLAKLFGCLVSSFFILLFGVMCGYLVVCF